MFKPKVEVYDILKDLPYWVSGRKPDTLKELPAIIFRCGNNSINLDLDNEIATQDLTIIIDIYTKKSEQCSNVLEEVEEIMRENYYRMTFSSDEVPARSGMSRINARFEKII